MNDYVDMYVPDETDDPGVINDSDSIYNQDRLNESEVVNVNDDNNKSDHG